jgi:hypothetical protein
VRHNRRKRIEATAGTTLPTNGGGTGRAVWHLRAANSFQISADNLDEVVGGIFQGLAGSGYMIPDVVFHKFRHKAVDSSTRSREAPKHIGAWRIFVKTTEDRFELADHFLSQ